MPHQGMPNTMSSGLLLVTSCSLRLAASGGSHALPICWSRLPGWATLI